MLARQANPPSSGPASASERAAGAAQAVARAAVLAGPFALAFFTGGYFAGARLAAGVVAWLCVLALAFMLRGPVPRPRPATIVAVAGLVLLTVWAAANVGRAPLAEPAVAVVQRDALYLGGLLAAALAFRTRAAGRTLEPGVAIGCLVVVGYGLAGRLLPALVVQHDQASAAGRLDQPLTYWNAMGALAAIGFVVSARLAGDAARPLGQRVLGAAGAPVLGLGAYLSYSRGALAALAVGLVVLALLTRTRSQLWAIARALASGGLVSLAASGLTGVASLQGSLATREAHGAAMLTLLAGVGIAAGALQARMRRAERPGVLTLRRSTVVAGWALAVALALAAPVAAVVTELRGVRADTAFGATPRRFGSLGSHRSLYWRVALDQWVAHPLAGGGPGSFRTAWLRQRTVDDVVRDAHSVVLETLTELGLVGLACLGACFGGVAAALRRLTRTDAELGAGLAAALAVWLVHAAIDWDWEMPALTLVAVLLAGGALGLADRVERAS